MHPEKYAEYLNLKNGKTDNRSRPRKTRQEQFEENVIKFILDSFGSLKIVESKSFRKIFDGIRFLIVIDLFKECCYNDYNNFNNNHILLFLFLFIFFEK